jgi:hypothetical protein
MAENNPALIGGGRFYVYTLTDPRTGGVFYVGKGQKERAWQHALNVRKGRRGCNREKERRISEILALNLTPQVAIVHRFECEQDALDTEADMIAALPGLTNIMAGGGKAMTQAQAQYRMDERRARIDRVKSQRTQDELRQFIERVSTWEGVTFPGMKNGDKKAQEFVQCVKDMLSKVDASRSHLSHG